MGLKIGGEVEKVDGKLLSYADFVEKYLVQNQPVILTGLMDHWRACKDWVLDNGDPNLRFLSTYFGNSRVQVADCGMREFTDQKRTEMSVSEFIDQWAQLSAARKDGGSDGNSLLYLKDWHFAKEYPDYVAYSPPKFFCDDWLNLYLDKYTMHNDPDTCQKRNEIMCSDYRFVYMGAKGTWTPLHADVFRSYSWSANVCGRKQWYFLPPSQYHLVFDRHMKSSVYNIFEEVYKSNFTGLEEAIWWECTQEKNEIIFVPSGWYHQVHNLEDTVSINHNWFNGHNISWVWDLLLREYHEAREYIEDIKDICDDFEGLCQRNLAANAGMNFYDFFVFMVRFSFANLVLLCNLTSDTEKLSWSSSQVVPLVIFNLKSIQCIALKMESTGQWKNSGVSIDLRETMEDQTFMEFCNLMARTYGAIYEQSEKKSDADKAVLEDMELSFLDFSGSRICTPEDLVTFIDCALKLS
ncbi:unnamed protein product [Fraxinus pennsylvanica]|uniref:JmjC domain-containing protein n=1 Tax=Fraxinus pennsylvanica TaxID=56036 RepID=A0AAD2AGT7_9LAMI|nr:unnamed protein product [Fraxinus pennsylvanica]